MQYGTVPRRAWRFYKTAAGAKLAQAELLELPAHVQAAIVEVMERKARDECAPNEDRAIKDSPLRELRTSVDGNAYRALYGTVAAHGEILLALTFVDKKADKLRRSTLKRARDRLQDWELRGADQVRRRKETGEPSKRERSRKKPRIR